MLKNFILCCFLFFPFILQAQVTPKKPLSREDYAGWKTISGTKISASGRLSLYEVNPQKGDGHLIIHDHLKNNTHTFSRGGKGETGALDEFVVYRIKQPEDSLRKARIKKVKKEEMPSDSLGIFITGEGRIVKFPRLKNFSVPEENSTWIAFTVAPENKKDTSRTEKKGRKPEKPLDELVLFGIPGGDTLVFKNVTEFAYPKKGGSVYFIQQTKDSVSTWSVVKRFDTTTSEVKDLYKGEGYFKKITTDDTGENYAFLCSGDTSSVKVWSLFQGSREGTVPSAIADGTTPGMPKGWTPSEHGQIFFSGDGNKLWFGTAPAPVQEPKDTIPEDEKPMVDVWNWKDTDLQPQQKVNLDREKKRSYLSVVHLGLQKFVQLADSGTANIQTLFKGKGNIALGEDDRAYRRASSWTGDNSGDFYVVDVTSGEKRLVLRNKERARLSPGGKYILWYEYADSSYHTLSTSPEDSREVKLTRDLPFNFTDELNDLPDDPRPYGIGGWGADDRYVFLYDRFDIWKADPSGKEPPVCVTKGYGRKNKVQLRYVKTDPEEEFIPEQLPALLSAFDTESMSGGFYTTVLTGEKEPRKLLMEAAHYDNVLKAKKGDRILWTRETTTEFPDLWSSTLNFGKPVKISSANPQQKDFNWMSVELVEWISFNGDTLKGLLYKPEDFDASRKYPMVVYFYERNSEGLHRHTIPSPSRSTINRPFYCSNGYLVFIPDIVYRTGFPGQSAYDAIVSGVYALAATRPFLDLTRVGLQGQSWGGYQTAYLITRTNLFAAAMAGAPVSNMTSAYGGIRWETGVSRMFQYEHTQSRIGGTLWEKPMQYLENSPLFKAPEITTPLLMMHNDNDGAVPWYQGIELFVALRRLDKPVWMLTYNGEPHNLKGESWANRMDLDNRMFQFFNHYLKGEPMPEWMGKGIPAIEKGKVKGY